MVDVHEVYNRCGSCRNFRPEHKDRHGRTLGQCHGKPTHPTVSSHEFGCPEYYLDRSRMLESGVAVPDDADLSPREREAARRQKAMQARPVVRARAGRSPGGHQDDGPAPRVRDIPLDEEGETMDRDALKSILAEVLDEALGLSDMPLHPRFRGGKVIVQPADSTLQSKEIDIDVLFRKIVAVREKLRVLEQKINSSDKLDQQDKVQIQQYITSCYGSMTSFNFLFRDRDDWFAGQG